MGTAKQSGFPGGSPVSKQRVAAIGKEARLPISSTYAEKNATGEMK